MTRIHAKSVALYVDEFNYSGFSNSADLEFTGGPAECTSFADTDATFVEGKPGFRWNVNGMYSQTDYDAEMFIDLTATSRRVGIYPGGATKGNYGYEGRSLISESPRVAPIGGAVALNVVWQGDRAPARGVLLDVDTAVAASGNGTAYQVGAIAAAETASGILRLLAAPGGAGNNTLDVVIQSSATEGGAYTTRLTFTQLTQASVALSEVQELAGANTDTWWRVAYTYAGVGSRTFSLVIGFGRRAT